VWLDYVRVDDEWAHFLFTDSLGIAPGNEILKFHQRIQDEVGYLSSANGFTYFYLDEYAYNNIPCIAEVNRLVKKYNPNTGLIAMNSEFALNGPGYLRKLEEPGHTGKHFFDTLLSSGAVTDVLIDECYPFDNYVPIGNSRRFVYYPTTLTLQQTLAGGVSKYYYQAGSSEQYNDDVNLKLEQNYWYYYLGVYRKCADLIKKAKAQNKEISLSMSIQNHTFEQNLGRGWENEYGLRDVTNEEVSMQSYLSLIYGAKQIMDYCYHSDPPRDTTDGTYYNNGLIYYNGDKRLTNYYGQPKWQFLCNLNAKLRQIGEILYPAEQLQKHLEFDSARTINTVYSGYHPDYKYGLPFRYISDIVSLYPDPMGNFPENNADPTEKRYWEAGTFLPPDSKPEDKFSKYFIMLNKRCTPPIANSTLGDVRNLKIKFDPSILPYFNNWVLTDPLTNTTIATINKNSGLFYNIGLFQPGEGRLFKLAPVMQEGGTLVCDENVLNTSFVCKAVVYSGGYKLSLISNNSSPMTVSFKTSGMIHGDNGSEVQIYGTQNNKITLQGFGNEKGNGIDCDEVSNLQVTNANILGMSGGWAISAYNCDGVYIENCNFNLTENGMRAINFNSTSNSNTYSNIINNTISVKNCSTPVYVISSANASNDLFFAGNTINSS
jgi:hypothetical protein